MYVFVLTTSAPADLDSLDCDVGVVPLSLPTLTDFRKHIELAQELRTTVVNFIEYAVSDGISIYISLDQAGKHFSEDVIHNAYGGPALAEITRAVFEELRAKAERTYCDEVRVTPNYLMFWTYPKDTDVPMGTTTVDLDAIDKARTALMAARRANEEDSE